MSEPYYADDLVTLWHGDCRDVLPSIENVAVTVTSPPYNTLGSRIPTTPTGGFGAARLGGWVANVNRDGYADDMDELTYAAWQIEIAAAVRAATSPGGSFFYNHKLRSRDGRCVHPIEMTSRFVGWRLRQEIVWDRGGAIAFNARMFAPSDERVVWMVRDDGKHKWNQEYAKALSIWRMSPPVDIDGHPCPYPLALPKRCIAAVTTTRDDTVLDPFAGSGTTLIAARECGRRAIGIEIEERFCEIAAKRLAQGCLDFGTAS